MLARVASIAVVALFVSSALSAQHVVTKYVSGEEVAKRTETVMKKIPWVNDLEQLKEKAAEENKLIFWLQIVGELDGGL